MTKESSKSGTFTCRKPWCRKSFDTPQGRSLHEFRGHRNLTRKQFSGIAKNWVVNTAIGALQSRRKVLTEAIDSLRRLEALGA